ncbi:hypothetical protein QL285_074798 [Trifolium repens]|nr:hypothetical protein QL285_074798 [Trifolium repens]
MVVGGGYTLLYAVAAGGIFYNAVDIWGEGVVYEAYRPYFAFPPSYHDVQKEELLGDAKSQESRDFVMNVGVRKYHKKSQNLSGD